jgi:ABC-type glycerol-3-phosphate transport system permease component
MVPGLLVGYRGVGQFMFLTRLIGMMVCPALWTVALINAAGAWNAWRKGNLALLPNHDKQLYLTKLNNLNQ